MSSKSNRVSRRTFNRGIAAAAAGTLAAPAFLRGQNLNNKLNIAVIACGGRGGANLDAVKNENIVALCDVNQHAVESASINFPQARKYSDFRKVFDHANEFDAVVVSTCEHSHAAATMLALKHNKHVYCEKPLTHDVWEARKIREMARTLKVATQMGVQIHAMENYHRVVELVRANVIGSIREAHVWVSRAWGLQSQEAAKKNHDIVYVTDRPTEEQTPPESLNWDLWLGPAPYRPFNQVYVPGPRWYRWWDFGNGTMSDLGSHWNDLPFWALELDAPKTIESTSPMPLHPEIAPATLTAVYEYGARGSLPPVKVVWHQGESKPEIWKSKGIPQWGDGVLFIGDKGMILSSYDKHVLLPETEFAGFTGPAPTLPRPTEHHAAWIDACKTGKPTEANFEYGGLLTEANHLGNIAFRIGKKIEWDAANLRCPNAPEADALLRRPYRKGWEL